MTNLSERRKLALANPALARSLQSMRTDYEAGFGKVSEMEMPAPISIPFAKASVPMEVTSKTFEHRQVLGTGDTSEVALADWRSWLDKCPQSGKELIWRVPPEIDCWCDFPSDKLIWKVYARMIIIPEEPEMTDITRKLELVANLKPGQMWPEGELGPAMDWGSALSAICAEALAEILRLRAHERASEKWLAELMPVTAEEKASATPPPGYPLACGKYWYRLENSPTPPVYPIGHGIPDDWRHVIKSAAVEYERYTMERQWPEVFGKTASQVIVDDPHEPVPEPWGSPFAMNTENWA